VRVKERAQSLCMTAGPRAALAWGVVVALLLGAACRAEEPLPDLWPAPQFALADQQGRPFGSADLAGRAAVVSFVYTNCPDICPLLTATMAQVQEKLQAEGLLGERVQLVSLTVDPDRDTPAVLAEYAGRHRADPDDWRFLTGDREAVYGVLEGFKLNTRAAARAYAGAAEVPHSNRFVVVDPAGHVRAQLRGDEVAPEEVVRTVKRVLSR
jgi:cytochrome oxidase Cu insertion factor (SCO1/SenC/PrrC family)